MSNGVRALFNLDGRVAVVTGGSRGLGLTIARTLGELGASVAVVARKRDELEAACATLAAIGIKAAPFVADLSKPDAVPGLADALVDRFGRIDVLVNNAAASWGESAETHSFDGWRKVMSLNVDAAFLLTQAIGKREFIPRRAGRVVNIASIGGLRGNRPDQQAFTLAYSTSKGAMVNFTRALASEWGRYGITVNALCPGFFESQMAGGLLERIGDKVVAATPLGRVAVVEDFVGPVAFLCSDAARHMTGQMLIIDGGLTSC